MITLANLRVKWYDPNDQELHVQYNAQTTLYSNYPIIHKETIATHSRDHNDDIKPTQYQSSLDHVA